MNDHSGPGPARSPEELHAILEDAFNRGDVDAYTDAYEHDATLVVPPEGQVVRGRADIRAASIPIFSLRPHATIHLRHKLEAGGLALTQAEWHLEGTEPGGSQFELDGHGAIVSRQQADGTWRILLDNPMSPR